MTLSELNRMMANNPDRFVGQDLDAYRNQISRNDLKELKQHQTDLLQQDGQALKRTEIYKATFEQADQLLQQLGRSTTSPNGERNPEVYRLNAQFFVNLKNRIDYELDQNEGQALNGIQIQDLIQKQLQTDFPDQAADLQALQDVSTSVSTSGAIVGALPASIGAGAVASDGIGSLANGIRAASSTGATATIATVGAIASGILLATTTAAGGGKIDESRDLEDGGNIRVTGWGDEAKRSLTFTDASGQTFSMTGQVVHDLSGASGEQIFQLSDRDANGKPLDRSSLAGIIDQMNLSGDTGMIILIGEETKQGNDGKPISSDPDREIGRDHNRKGESVLDLDKPKDPDNENDPQKPKKPEGFVPPSEQRDHKDKTADKLLWGEWSDYPKIVRRGPHGPQEYAVIGGRLYSHHAVGRMRPSGQRYSSGAPAEGLAPSLLGDNSKYVKMQGIHTWDGNNTIDGRSVSPEHVEYIIKTTSGEPDGDNMLHRSDNVAVVVSPQGRVVSVITE